MKYKHTRDAEECEFSNFKHLNLIGFSKIRGSIDDAVMRRVFEDEQLEFARISREDRVGYQVLCATASGDIVSARALSAGGMRYRAQSREDLPAVGDWVVLRWAESPETPGVRTSSDAMIVEMIPRRSRLLRQAAGVRTDAQVIAANLDVLFVVTSMNAEFEPRRLERYVLAAQESGSEAVIILNKSDLVDNPERYLEQARAVVPEHVQVIALCSLEGDTKALSPWLTPGSTCALVGSSGVGKSTLSNAIMQSEQQLTKEIREDDAEGRHTTTARHLLVLPDDQGVLIDTPGMRELQLWAGEDSGMDVLFSDIEELTTRCRFRNCQHEDEPGCAVQEALESGELDPGRLYSWRKLGRELEWRAKRQDVATQREESRRRGRMIKQIVKHRKNKKTHY